ncbi:MAG: hypothetical protein ACXWMJ_08060 [Syntrophales bacterium]
MDRDKLIRKLKTVKNPRERDKIIWALAGKEKDAMEETPVPVQSGKTNATPVREQVPGLPKLPIDARKLLNYIAPAIFLFFGLVNLLQAIAHFIETGQIEAAMPQLIMGIMFFVFGVFSFAKAKKRVQGVNADKKEA